MTFVSVEPDGEILALGVMSDNIPHLVLQISKDLGAAATTTSLDWLIVFTLQRIGQHQNTDG